MPKTWMLVAWGALGAALIVLNAVTDGPRWWGALGGAIGGFILCQALYSKWLNDYHDMLDRAHENNDRLIGWLDQIRAGRQRVN